MALLQPAVITFEDLLLAWKGHQDLPKEPKGTVRLFDKHTPYAVHPIGAALLVTTEVLLPTDTRRLCAQILCRHDLVEDTNLPLPATDDPRVVHGVAELTFFGGSKEKFEKIWDRSLIAQLCELYDVLWNNLDGINGWMANRPPEYAKASVEFMLKLARHVHSRQDELTEGKSVQRTTTLNVISIIEGVYGNMTW